MGLDPRAVESIEKETGCRLVRLTHMAGGEDSASRFERDTKANLDAIVGILSAVGKRRS